MFPSNHFWRVMVKAQEFCKKSGMPFLLHRITRSDGYRRRYDMVIIIPPDAKDSWIKFLNSQKIQFSFVEFFDNFMDAEFLRMEKVKL
jgi:ribosomal protein L32